MRTALLSLVIAVSANLAPALAFADAPTLARVLVTKTDPLHADVYLDKPVLEATVDRDDYWLLLLTSKTVAVQPKVTAVTITGCERDTTPRSSGPCPPGDGVVAIRLALDRPAPEALTAIQIIYQGPLGVTLKTFEIDDPESAAYAGADKDEADVSVSGSYAWTAHDAGAKYNIDAFGGYMWQLSTRQYWGGYGQAKSKDASSASPQSYLTYAAYQSAIGTGGFKGPFQSPIFNGLAGFEFDQKGEETNFVVSPRLSLAFRASRGTLGRIEPGFTVPNGALHAGLEVVKPLRSSMDDEAVRYRFLLGATFVAGVEVKKPGFYGWSVRGLAEVRFLSSDEPFLDPTHAPIDEKGKKGDAPLEFGSDPRPHTEFSANYLFAKWAGLELKYEYGSQPPAFSITDHTVSLNLTLTLRQTSYARTAILKP